MKLIILALGISIVSCSLLKRKYRSQTEIPIVRYEYNGVKVDGSYQWKYETGDGISAEEKSGLIDSTNPESDDKEVSGSYEYSTDDGTRIRVSYIANKDGFQPRVTFLPISSTERPQVVTASRKEGGGRRFQDTINININDNESILHLSNR